jgi:hypothetical protein
VGNDKVGPSHRVFAALADDLTWFIKCPEIRVLHVATSGTERPVVVHQLMLTEGHGHNRSPFFVLEDAHTKDDDGWMARAERVAVIHGARREAMAKEGYALRPIPPLAHGGAPLPAFAWQLEQCLDAQRDVPEVDGLVVVLAPAVLERPTAFAESVLSLVQGPSLARVRFIVVEVGDEVAVPVSSKLGDAAMCVACRVDPAHHRREQSEALAASAAAPLGASPEVSAGRAGPKDVIAPPRHGKPPRDAAVSPEAQELLSKELGPAVALLGASGARLRHRLSAAALALQERRFGEAIALQSEACKQCLEAGLSRLGCVLEITLATYLFHAGDVSRSRSAFETAASRAEAFAFADVTAQALLGLAAVLVVARDVEGATRQYVRAGELAETAGLPLLAIEAYRTAGQIALQARAEEAAVIAWRRALAVAEVTPPEPRGQSSAPTVARALAKVMEDRGSFASASSLLAQAEEWERSAAGASNDRALHAPSAAPGAPQPVPGE